MNMDRMLKMYRFYICSWGNVVTFLRAVWSNDTLTLTMYPSSDQLCTKCQLCLEKNFPKIKQNVCNYHGICWCAICVQEYKENGFTMFNNSCSHFEAQCTDVEYSLEMINQIEFLLKYANHLEWTLYSESD